VPDGRRGGGKIVKHKGDAQYGSRTVASVNRKLGPNTARKRKGMEKEKKRKTHSGSRHGEKGGGRRRSKRGIEINAIGKKRGHKGGGKVLKRAFKGEKKGQIQDSS